jgi:hypothetical protein
MTTPGVGLGTAPTIPTRRNSYPPIGVPAVQPAPGGNQTQALLRGSFRGTCPVFIPAVPPAKPVEPYKKYRKRLIIHVEGELMLGIPPGLVARDIVQTAVGKVQDLLIEVSREVLYRVADPTATPPVISGLEHILDLLDTDFGQERDEIEEDAMDEFEIHWRKAGEDMYTFRTEHIRKYEKANKEAKLSMSDSYRAKRLLERAQIRKTEKLEIMSKVDADWEKFQLIEYFLGKLFKYEKGEIPRPDEIWRIHYVEEEM